MAERIPKLTTVEAKTWLTPRMVRLVLGGEALEGFGAGKFTDHYVKLLLPPAGAPYSAPFDAAAIKPELPRDQWPRMRTFTVRDWEFVASGFVPTAVQPEAPTPSRRKGGRA